MKHKNGVLRPPVSESCSTLYVAGRRNSKPFVVVQTLEHKAELQSRLDLIRHCPAGFDWADGSSSGAAQLAIALLAHASGDDSFAREHYQVFKHEIILRLPKAGWTLSRGQVLQMLRFVTVNCGSRERYGKAAVIHAVLPESNSQRVITVKGSGRSTRGAATRALMNLLGHKDLERRQILGLQIELSVTNSLRNPVLELDPFDEFSPI